MKRFFTRLSRLFIFLFFPGLLFAQGNNSYDILLNSGKFIPQENVTNLSKGSDIFKKSLFNDKYYVVIQFRSLPTEALKDQLKKLGVELLDYIPNNAYTASVNQTTDVTMFSNFSIRSVFYMTSVQKADAALLLNSTPAHALKINGFADVDIILYEDLSADRISTHLSVLGGSIINHASVFRMYSIRIPVNNLSRLVALPFVQWAEFIAPPNKPENLPGRTLHRVNILQDGVRNLKGDGMNIGIFDEVASQHLDFSPAGRLINIDAGAAGSHGTHVSGTVGGKGIINPIAKGMAPNATIYSYDAFGGGDVQVRMSTEIPTRTLISSNHSYHDGLGVQCGVTGASVAYSLRARNTDINLNNNLYHLHCHSSGNAQTSCTGGWGTITGTGKAAKNNLVVGSISSLENLSSFSSCGPVHDGRVKPEIVAMGESVFSTYTPLNSYNTISGTSMSTPGITGTVALLAQRYKQLNGNVLPPSALIKNIVCNTASDLGNPGPDYRFGFGRINALQAVRILEQNRYAVNNVTTGTTNDININVPAGAARLRVMLTWNDPAAAANSNPALVNNLNLTVIQGVTTTLPWILDPNNPANNSTRAVDNVSNIEQVTIDNPSSGEYILRVNGFAVPTGPNQSYALTWSVEMPNIEVIYPNGGESFSPGVTQTITWDNVGVTGNQTIEYSVDNGSNWTTISIVGPATSRLNWSVPAANTSTALVRVSSGAITDVSDATFKILGTTTGFSTTAGGCSTGEVNFIWNAVTNATHYDVYRLDNTTGLFVILASNVTGTSYTATGLTSGASMWFAIVAKNNTTGAASERANAINATVSSGGGGLGTIGSITGQSIICGTPTGVPYSISSVSGATTYTWSAPPGATIASGQGTTSITINYPGGSSNGNVAVFAGNGTCNTTTSTLPITIASAGIAAPTGGGNQSQTVCPGGTVPTLTATATVPVGHTVVWYDAASGGMVVASPTLSAAGTVTYHAASRNTASGCESITRTPVVLTITQVAAATISANGPTTFCQGGSVVLTATTGTSYLWSNGATTQSITVLASGSYSVIVTTAGCNSSTPATVVAVNPTPAANITAGGATTFCQGLNVVLTAPAGSSWLWSNGATTQAITVTASGNYSVTVTNGSGCSATSAATTVTVNPNPAAIIAASSSTTFCQGGSVTLTASAGTSYLWSNGATSQSITINSPIGTTNYSVQVTQTGGCVSSSTATTVTVNSLPVANITASGPLNFCQGSNVILTASAGSSWLWTNGTTTQTITVSSTSSHSVRVTNANGCFSNSPTTAIAVSPNPTVSISASPYTRLFPGLSTTLTANVTPPGSYNYVWLKNGVPVPGATSSTLTGIDLSKLGNYTVAVTNTSGLPCSNVSAAMPISDSATTKLFIFPSPNGGQFSVSYYLPGINVNARLLIYDSQGRLIYNSNYVLNAAYQIMNVDIRRNSKGIHNVLLFDNTGRRLASGTVLIQ